MKAKNYFYKTLVFSAIWVFVCFGIAAFSISRALQDDPQVWKKALGRLGMEFTSDDSFGVIVDSDHDGSDEQDQVISRSQGSWTFQVPEKVLKFQISSGEVVIAGGKSNEVKVLASGSVRGGVKDQVLTVQSQGGELLLKTPDGVQVDNLSVKVEVPSASQMKISVQIVNGKAVIENLQFDSLSMRSVAGDMILNSVAVGQADLKTVSGKVEFSGKLEQGLKIVTLSGPVAVGMADGGQVQFDLNSISGEIENAFSSQKNGATKVKIQTTSGSIRIFQK